MAEFAALSTEIAAQGVEIIALSVDEPMRSRAMKKQLGLPFRVLCDTSRQVIREWQLYNAYEAGGIAIPAVYLIGPGQKALYASIDEVTRRIDAQSMLDYLRRGPEPDKRRIKPGATGIGRMLYNLARHGLRSPTQ